MKKAGIVFLLLLTSTNSSLAYWYTNQQLHSAGIKALRSNNPSLAAKYFSQAAANEHPSSMNNLGYLYLKGNGISKDYKKARQYFRAAADLGDVSAIMNLGYLYANGLGLPKSYSKAEALYRVALNKGHPQAKKALTALGKEKKVEEEQFRDLSNLAVEVQEDQQKLKIHTEPGQDVHKIASGVEEQQSDNELSQQDKYKSTNDSSPTSYYEELYRVELEVTSTDSIKEKLSSIQLEQGQDQSADTESEITPADPETDPIDSSDNSRGPMHYPLLIILSAYLLACASNRNCFISYLDGLGFFALTLFFVRDLGLVSPHWLILILFSIYFTGRIGDESISLSQTLQTALWRTFMTIPALFGAWFLNFFQ